jgi:hypothetical protein
MARVSSDPHFWLRPFYVHLRENPSFSLLSPSHQFEQLCGAVEAEQPGKAAQMGEWSPGAQKGCLGHLAMMVEQTSSESQVELWRVTKADLELKCVAVHLPIEIDVRLLEGDDFRRTQLWKLAPEVERLSDGWRKALLGVGWSMK